LSDRGDSFCCAGSTPTPAWEDYGRLHELTREQLYWAFCKNRDFVTSAGGDTANPSPWFKQEYPATASEAFETSGANAFIEPIKVLKARKAKVEGFGPIILGVDPAGGGKDRTGFIDRQGRRLGGHICKRVDFGDNQMAIVDAVRREAQSCFCPSVSRKL
jgi:hypothetical protein